MTVLIETWQEWVLIAVALLALAWLFYAVGFAEGEREALQQVSYVESYQNEGDVENITRLAKKLPTIRRAPPPPPRWRNPPAPATAPAPAPTQPAQPTWVEGYQPVCKCSGKKRYKVSYPLADIDTDTMWSDLPMRRAPPPKDP